MGDRCGPDLSKLTGAFHFPNSSSLVGCSHLDAADDPTRNDAVEVTGADLKNQLENMLWA